MGTWYIVYGCKQAEPRSDWSPVQPQPESLTSVRRIVAAAIKEISFRKMKSRGQGLGCPAWPGHDSLQRDAERRESFLKAKDISEKSCALLPLRFSGSLYS